MNPRTKGKNGEREARFWLAAALGCDPDEITRNLEQTRAGGADILGIDGLAIEVKRQETLTIDTWWRQVCRAADARHELPVLMYRQNRGKWNFCLPAYLLRVGMTGRITLGENEFRQWLKHWVH